MRKILLRGAGDGEAKEVGLERADPNRAGSYRAVVDGRPLDLEVALHGTGAGWLRVQGRMLPFRSTRTPSSVEVWIGGRRYVIDVVDRTARRTSEAGGGAASNDLTAPMPGTILRIDARPGATFEAHTPLIVMESMKMEMTLSVPAPTMVKEVLCHEGELVEMGELLARLEPARDAEPTITA